MLSLSLWPLVFFFPVQGFSAEQKLAVLELRNHAKISLEEAQYLTGLVRAEAVKRLPKIESMPIHCGAWKK